MLESITIASMLRDKDRDFHGLEREFMMLQEEILKKFKQVANVKHIRDLGNIREDLLRELIADFGYFPNKIGVSKTSARVISPTGHSTKEMDIVLFDRDNSINLM
jgi:hypothetical protein